MESSVLTVHLTVELKKELDRLAEQRQRDRSVLIAEAVAAFAQEQAVISGIEQGLEDAALGRVMSHDEAMQWLRAVVDPDR